MKTIILRGKFIFMITLLELIFLNLLKAQEISDQLVGVNAWYTNPSEQVWGLTADCGVQTIRIGGHAFDDILPSKTSLLNWVKKIQAMGAEPVIQVSQYQPASVAADLVRYFNIEKSGEVNPVKYWNIGNEPWLQYNNLQAGTDVGTLVETYFKPISVAMKDVDSTIKIYGPDFCYYVDFAINDLFGGKNNIAGKVPGKDYYYCDGITWHKYPQADNINLAYGGIDDFSASIVKCKQKVDQVNALYNRTGDNALIWGIGEFNAKNGTLVHSWENGQMFGGILGLCMKYEAEYATSWSMFENSGNRQGTDFSFIDGAHMTPRASYRHMEFVAKYFKGRYIDGTSSSSDFIVYGAKNEEQTAIMIMHRASGQPREYSLLLNDTATAQETINLRVNAEMSHIYRDFIGPRTTQVIIFRGDSILRINYSSEDFDNERPPFYLNFGTTGSIPAEPGELLINPLSYSKIALSWNDNSDNELGFLVERKTSGEFSLVKVLPPNTTTYTDSDLTPETTYSYRLRAFNYQGKSEYSNLAEAGTLQVPAAKPYNGPHAIPGLIQAEDFNDNEAGLGYFDTDAINEGKAYRTTGVDIESSAEGGYNIGYVKDGEWLKYLIENVSPGNYDVSFRIASSNSTSSKRIDVYLNELYVGNVTPVYTGGWQVWKTIILEDVKVPDSDSVLLRLEFKGESFNLNWIEFTRSFGVSSDIFKASGNLHAWYNDQAEKIIIDPGSKKDAFQVRITNMQGRLLHTSVCQDPGRAEISTTRWGSGIYIVSILNREGFKTQKIFIR